MRPTLLLMLLCAGCGDVGLQGVPDEVIVAGNDAVTEDDPVNGADADEPEASGATEIDLTGTLYTISPEDLTVEDPPGLDGMKDQFLDRNLLVWVAEEGSSEITMDVTLAAANGAQDPCERVVELPEGDWENPLFEVGPGELSTTFGGHPATFQALRMRGTFAGDAESWEGELSAVLDARELAPAVPEVDDVCGLVEALGGACEPCDDGDVSCFALQLGDVRGERINRSFDPTPTCD